MDRAALCETAPFASGRSACAERTDTIELVRPEHSVSFDAHSTRTCDTPEQIMERVGGRHVIPYPEEDGWREGLDWRDELDNEELTTPDYHKNLEACWDKEFESFAGRRDRAPNADKDTLPGGTEKPNALAQTDVGRHATPQAKVATALYPCLDWFSLTHLFPATTAARAPSFPPVGRTPQWLLEQVYNKIDMTQDRVWTMTYHAPLS
ncbi:hypothetical protein G6011_08084 [Alternaria panax]|uniref:Uncharacterized protein n=1 Tax=Alternaria panax TaxID=48097 RepID=A0AAD4FI12_9PLEO|nr:hypothetical protein G6011_08084 [Alternaria panax]